jgi:nucleotide-binding universal stress UspA family protein
MTSQGTPEPREPERPWPGIVVGVDGSPSSRDALGWSIGMAQRLGVAVLALRVGEDVFTARRKGFCSRGQAEEWAAAERREGEAMMADMLRELGHDPDAVEVELAVVPGQAAEVLIEYSRAAEMLALGPRGFGRLRKMFGSVSHTCVSHASCPVVIVPTSEVRPDR